MQQLLQRLHRRQVAGHRRGLFAGHKLRAVEQLQVGLLAQLAQGRGQRLCLDLDCAASLFGVAVDGHGTDRESQRQGAKAWQGFVVVHVVRHPEVRDKRQPHANVNAWQLQLARKTNELK
ncbi:hypothetical protein D3C76_815660 [compost metagenome]